ncbi:MAG: hypothetical protein ACJASQ_004042 [Crocinitomicaceae bacterium]|jgi:hypothetical protein
MKCLFPLIVLFCFFGSNSYGQEPQDSTKTKKVIVTTVDERQHIGVILSDDGREILLLTESVGKVYLRKDQVVSIKPFINEEVEIYDGDYRTIGPFTTRYYLTTNSLPIKKNEDYAMIHLYGPEVHFSLSDRFSLGLMTTWIASPFVLAAKYTFPTKSEKINFGLGTLAGTSGYLNTFRGFGGLHWGMVTFGDRSSNITFSAGYTYAQYGFQTEREEPGTYPVTTDSYGYINYNIPYTTNNPTPMIKSPVFSIAGVTKVGKRASFFFDSMVFLYSSDERKVPHHEIIYDGMGVATAVEVTEITVSEHNEIEGYGYNNDYSSGVLILAMPGMRFQKKENNAFQVALAGFTRISGGRVLAFPVPMCSWFIKF